MNISKILVGDYLSNSLATLDYQMVFNSFLKFNLSHN
jgi:hypothetical protein